MAGELVPGEQVLTKNGEAAVASKVKLDGVHTVYNLEVRELHNFLVGDVGVVVHNSCADIFRDLCDIDFELKKKIKPKLKPAGHKHPISGVDANKIETKYGKVEVCFDDFGFPDMMPFVKKIGGATEAIVEIAVTGNSSADIANANKKLAEELNLPLNTKFHGYDGFEADGIRYTWHHHQDGKHMMLIPSNVNQIQHAGGAVMARADLKGMLPNPWHTKNHHTTKCF
jgi:hypothetical protein